jgi:uncharacterized protein YqeY
MLDQLQADLKDAQLARDKVRTQVLKSLKASLQNERIEVGDELSGEQQLVVLQRELKKRTEATEMYQSAGRTEQAEVEKAEIEVLKDYLPEQLSDQELIDIIQSAIDEVNATSVEDMGKVMSVVSPQVTGKADKAEVAVMVKDLLRA